MKTNEAIELLDKRNILDKVLKMKIKDVKKLAKLLQQGEAYKQMWKEFKRKCEFYLVGIEEKEKQGNLKIGDFIDVVERKYFPKQRYFPPELKTEKAIKDLFKTIDEIRKLLNVQES